jgi:hypothetical protein
VADDIISQLLGAASGFGGVSDYKATRQVRARAAAIPQGESEAERQAVLRLGRLLASGQPLDPEVPRGFYLNIRV